MFPVLHTSFIHTDVEYFKQFAHGSLNINEGTYICSIFFESVCVGGGKQSHLDKQ